MRLEDRRCKPCEGGVIPLTRDQIEPLLAALDPAWSLDAESRTLSRVFDFPAYSRSLAFANAVAWIAISEGHHPEIVLRYDAVEVHWTTYAIGGLSDNDFICAAKTQRLVASP